ncbi:MAG: FHA domain-containing protein [Chloroflexota bacterium]|nr:FHA domain-containing protein [Chloroflexota bacterium]
MSDTSSDRPVLIVQQQGKLDLRWTVELDEALLGRDDSCHLVIAEREVSRQHVRIYKHNEAFYIEDLESRNGTWVNEEKLEGTRALHNGDKIKLGTSTHIEFVGSNFTAPISKVDGFEKGSGLRIDTASRRVFINQVELDPPLSPPQYRLLELLYLNAGTICTREQVIDTVWPDAYGEGVSEQAIDALIRRLRDRLSDLDSKMDYVVTVRGHGFRLGG